jgi:hypothetical protein
VIEEREEHRAPRDRFEVELRRDLQRDRSHHGDPSAETRGARTTGAGGY